MWDYRQVKVGDIVYPAYVPAQVGRVVSVDATVPGLPKVLIRMRNGKEILTDSYNDYASLVAEHHRKYERHAAILADCYDIKVN